MPIKNKLRHSCRSMCIPWFMCAVSLVGIFASAQVGAAEDKYIVTDLGPVLSTGDAGKDINNSGVAAYTRGTGVYLWQNGVGANINNLFAGNGPLSINDSGHLAGADDLQAYIYRDGVKTDLGALEHNEITFAYDLNNSDVVVGESYTDIRYRAFIWQNGVMTELVGPGMSRDTQSVAFAINNLGQVAGAFNTQSPGSRATVWNQGVPTFLDTLDGYTSSQAFDINESGQVVGYSWNSVLYPEQAVIWNGTTPTSLGALSGLSYSKATGINDLGVVVGFAASSDSDSDGRAFRWMDNQMVNLNTLLEPGSPWLLKSAYAINNAGQIVGFGTVNGAPRSFLLTPVPEPASFLAAAVFALALNRRQRAS